MHIQNIQNGEVQSLVRTTPLENEWEALGAGNMGIS